MLQRAVDDGKRKRKVVGRPRHTAKAIWLLKLAFRGVESMGLVLRQRRSIERTVTAVLYIKPALK
jgi:hypothetical protein